MIQFIKANPKKHYNQIKNKWEWSCQTAWLLPNDTDIETTFILADTLPKLEEKISDFAEKLEIVYSAEKPLELNTYLKHQIARSILNIHRLIWRK